MRHSVGHPPSSAHLVLYYRDMISNLLSRIAIFLSSLVLLIAPNFLFMPAYAGADYDYSKYIVNCGNDGALVGGDATTGGKQA